MPGNNIMVIQANVVKKETYNIMSIDDLEELVVKTMGEDVWNAIMYFTYLKEEEKESLA